MINFCPNCKSIINAGATFCAKCGVNILDFNEKREVTKEVTTEVETTDVAQPLQKIPLLQEKNKKSNTAPAKVNLPKTYFSALSALFIIAGCINILYGFIADDLAFITYTSISSGVSSILIGVILMKIDEILQDFKNRK